MLILNYDVGFALKMVSDTYVVEIRSITRFVLEQVRLEARLQERLTVLHMTFKQCIICVIRHLSGYNTLKSNLFGYVLWDAGDINCISAAQSNTVQRGLCKKNVML